MRGGNRVFGVSRGLVVVEPDGRHVVSAGRVPVQTGDDVARVFVGEDGHVAGRNRRRGRACGDDGDDVVACAYGGVGGHLGRHDAALRDREGLGASNVDGPRAGRYPVIPDRHVFFDGDLSVVGVASVHVDDVLDGVRTGGDTLVMGIWCRVGHGRERRAGARVEGAGRDTCGGLTVMDARVPVRSSHGNPVAGSVPATHAVIQGGHPGRRKRGDTGRGLCRRRVQVLAHPLPGQ